MNACSDPQVLISQLQSILDTANKALSIDQVRLLAREIQQTTGGAAGSSDKRKRQTTRCDGIDYGSTLFSMKPQIDINIPSELQAGRFKCGCLEWVSLRDDTGFTLAPWVAHLLVCKQSNAAGTTSQVATSDIAEDIISKSNSKGASPASCSISQSVPNYEEDGPSAVSMIAKSDLSSSLEVSQAPLPLVLAATKPEVAVSPGVEPASRSDKPLSTSMSCDHTDSGSNVAKLAIDNHAKQPLSQPIIWDPLPRRRRPNRSEAERIQEFHADPYVAEVEPFRVRCALCDKWIKLRNNSRYCSIPWKCHREGCTRLYVRPPETEITTSSSLLERSSQNIQLHSNTSSRTQGTPDMAVSSTSQEPSTLHSSTTHSSTAENANPSNAVPGALNVPPPSSVHPSLQLHGAGLLALTQASSSTIVNAPNRVNPSGEPRRPRVCDEEQRRATLQADPHAEIVEPCRVLCALCKRWVKLRTNSTYCSTPWYSHIRRCVYRQKRVNAATKSRRGGSLSTPDIMNNSIPDNPSGSHCRETCDLEYTYRFEYIDEPINLSYHEVTSTSNLKDSILSQQPKKRGGHPPKNMSLETKHNDAEDDGEVASEMSYESEEQ